MKKPVRLRPALLPDLCVAKSSTNLLIRLRFRALDFSGGKALEFRIMTRASLEGAALIYRSRYPTAMVAMVFRACEAGTKTP